MPEFQAILFDFDGVLVDSEMVHTFAKLADPPADPARLWEQYPLKRQRFRERMAAHAPFAQGVGDFFRELAAHYKLGVVSSRSHAEIEPFLEAAGIRRY